MDEEDVEVVVVCRVEEEDVEVVVVCRVEEEDVEVESGGEKKSTSACRLLPSGLRQLVVVWGRSSRSDQTTQPHHWRTISFLSNFKGEVQKSKILVYLMFF